jgi:16S rRNA C1402 (ribose-2'-O) methylase RsmI
MRASHAMVVAGIRKNIFCFENFVTRPQATARERASNKAAAYGTEWDCFLAPASFARARHLSRP